MNFTHVSGLVLRYTVLYTRSVPRIIELFFWPVMDLLVWGFLTVYLRDLPRPVEFLIGGMIFWDILYRAQQGTTLSFLEDIWSRNLLNVFVAPVTLREFILATYLVGFAKILVTVAVLTLLAAVLYHFNLFLLGFNLLPFIVNLLLMGWAVGLVTTALIMRWGQSAEALAWGIPFLIQPFAAVFYPVDVLPKFAQPIALGIPATHVFEGMRQILERQPIAPHLLPLAFGLNLVYLAAAGFFFRHMFGVARRKGLLAKLGTQ